jgi:hypothetical protein
MREGAGDQAVMWRAGAMLALVSGSLPRASAGTRPTGSPAVYVLPIVVAASIGATARAARLGAGNCVVGRAVAPLT